MKIRVIWKSLGRLGSLGIVLKYDKDTIRARWGICNPNNDKKAYIKTILKQGGIVTPKEINFYFGNILEKINLKKKIKKEE